MTRFFSGSWSAWQYRFTGRALAWMLSVSLLGCAAETEPLAVESDHAAEVPGHAWDTFSYSRCMAVLEHLGTLPEHSDEVQALFDDANDDGMVKANALCGQVADALARSHMSVAIVADNPAGSIAALVAVVVALVVIIVGVPLLKRLLGDMVFNRSIQTDAELGTPDLLAAYDVAWEALSIETQTSWEPRKDWLKDSVIAWYTTFQNSQQARRQPPNTKNCYAVGFGDNAVARDINEYAASPCAQDPLCEVAKQQVAINLSLLQATPTIGLYYNECLQQVGFFTPSR